jgi:ABC-2 type transport system ATP-binding protein
MISFQNITKKYGSSEVLNIPNWEIGKNEIVGLIGNNGAGKTTAFSILVDLIKPTTGNVTSHGQDVSNTEEWKQYTSSFLDDSFLIGFLTPDEYFEFIGMLSNLTLKEVKEFVEGYEEFFNDEILGKKKYLRDLSKGNQKKVGLIASLIGNPEVLVLDEPFSNLDPSSQIRLKKIIENSSRDKTILISSHDLNHILDICTRIVLLEKGKIIRDLPNSPEAVLEIQSYFNTI